MSTDSKVILRMTMSLHGDENVIGLPATTISEVRSEYVILPLELPYDGSPQSVSDVNKRHLDYLAQCRDDAVVFLRPRLAETISETLFHDRARQYYHEQWKLRPVIPHNPMLTNDQIRDRIGKPVWVEPIARWGLLARAAPDHMSGDGEPLHVIVSADSYTAKSFKVGGVSAARLYDFEL